MHGHQEQLVLLKRMEILISMELTQYLSLIVETLPRNSQIFKVEPHQAPRVEHPSCKPTVCKPLNVIIFWWDFNFKFTAPTLLAHRLLFQGGFLACLLEVGKIHFLLQDQNHVRPWVNSILEVLLTTTSVRHSMQEAIRSTPANALRYSRKGTTGSSNNQCSPCSSNPWLGEPGPHPIHIYTMHNLHFHHHTS